MSRQNYRKVMVLVAAGLALCGAGARAELRRSPGATPSGARLLPSGALTRSPGISRAAEQKLDDATAAELLNTRFRFDVRVLEIDNAFFDMDHSVQKTKPWRDAILSDEKTVEVCKFTLQTKFGRKAVYSDVEERSYPVDFVTNAVTGKVEPAYFETQDVGTMFSITPVNKMGDVVSVRLAFSHSWEPKLHSNEFGEYCTLSDLNDCGGGRTSHGGAFTLGVPAVELIEYKGKRDSLTFERVVVAFIEASVVEAVPIEYPGSVTPLLGRRFGERLEVAGTIEAPNTKARQPQIRVTKVDGKPVNKTEGVLFRCDGTLLEDVMGKECVFIGYEDVESVGIPNWMLEGMEDSIQDQGFGVCPRFVAIEILSVE